MRVVRGSAETRKGQHPMRLVVEFPHDMSRATAEAIAEQIKTLPEDEWKPLVISSGGTIRDLDVPSVLTDEDVERIARRTVELLKSDKTLVDEIDREMGRRLSRVA